MHTALTLLAIAVAVLAVTALADRIRFSAPLLLMLVGIVASFVPGIPALELHPEVILLGFLPPLLYATAIRTSVLDFHSHRRSIAFLSILLVVFTALGVGLVAWLLLPGITFPVAFALGAVVAPPDAVAATSIARRVGLPRRVVTLLEGESLLNDATAITCLRVAIVAVGGTVSAGRGRARVPHRGGRRTGRRSGRGRRGHRDPQAGPPAGLRHRHLLRAAVRRLPAGRADHTTRASTAPA